MDDASFAAYEPQFYREEMARRPGSKILEHKRAYERLQAAHEIHGTVRRLARLRGHVEYVPIDVTDAEAIDREIARIVADYGRIDFVVHGAGVQTSVLLPKRKLGDWRRTLETKLAGLRNVYTACRRRIAKPVHFHILTSAFSYFGNDGQPDYGAANDAMNRLADYMGAGDGEHWTTLAWLAWDGIGMTRGSEYAALAKERNPYPLGAAVGREIFARLIAGRATAPSNILLTAREQRALSGIAIASQDEQAALARGAGVRERRGSRQWILTIDNAPYLLEHVVSGTPTLPGTFEIELAAQAARELRPDRYLIGIENATFQRFLRVPTDRQVALRGEASVVSEDDGETIIHVRLLSDFVHKNGKVLQKDIVHFEVDARLATAPLPVSGPCRSWERFDGRPAFDPYVAPGSPVQLGGLFSCLDDIVIGPERRRARFRLPQTTYEPTMRDFVTPPVLLDAMMRFGSLAPEGGSPSVVFVPDRGAKIRIEPGFNDVTLNATQPDIYLVAANPQLEGDTVLSQWVQAMDAKGRTLVVTEASLGRRMEGIRIRA
jgi:NAD(P)-dependent dehydrogenase (short-subunit alcohol dehydrogenase family)